MAKKGGKVSRTYRRAKAAVRRSTPRGGRLSIMFKTAIAVGAAALVGGAALNVVNTTRDKPAEGLTAGVTTFGAGALLAFLLGMFKGSRQYVTPVLAGATAVGVLSAMNGPLSRGSQNIANALLGKKAPAGGGTASGGASGGGIPKSLPSSTTTPMGGGTPRKISKGEQLLALGNSMAQLGAGIAASIGGARGGATPGLAGARGDDDEMDGSEGLDDFKVAGGGDLDGSEGMDDFAIIGAGMMGDD